MRKLLLVTVALSLVVFAALPSSVSAQTCNPYNQGLWETKAPIPTPIVRAWGQFFPGNGNFYAMGGRQSDTAGSDYLNPHEYNPGTNTWTTKVAAFPDNQVNNMVGGVLNIGGTNVIVLVGGSAAGAVTATAAVRTYNPVTDTITPLASDNWPGNAAGTILPGGAAVLGNILYVFGGFNINVSMTSQIWAFDGSAPAGSRWSLKAASLPQPRGYIPTSQVGGMFYMAGGALWDGATLQDTTDTVRYDPVADSVTVLASTPRATGETRAVTQAFDGQIWVIGGGRVPPNPSAQVDAYNPGTNTWSTAPSMLTARRNFPVDMNGSGDMWAVGGYDAGGLPSTTNEHFFCQVPVDLMTFGVE
jgi:N-acetylneuraminic acid mutarotase